jgi:hypothetical protein
MFEFFKRFFASNADVTTVEVPAPVEQLGGAERAEANLIRRDAAIDSAHKLFPSMRMQMPETGFVDGEERFYKPKSAGGDSARMIWLRGEMGHDTVIVQDRPTAVSMYKFGPLTTPVHYETALSELPMEPTQTIGDVEVNGVKVETSEAFLQQMEAHLGQADGEKQARNDTLLKARELLVENIPPGANPYLRLSYLPELSAITGAQTDVYFKDSRENTVVSLLKKDGKETYVVKMGDSVSVFDMDSQGTRQHKFDGDSQAEMYKALTTKTELLAHLEPKLGELRKSEALQPT